MIDGPPQGRRGTSPFTADLADRNRIGHMMFPGSTISNTFHRPDEVQQTIIDKKFKHTKEFDLHDQSQLREAWDYDNRPDVIARRRDAMPWSVWITTNELVNDGAFWLFNAGVVFAGSRMSATKWRNAIGISLLMAASVILSPGQATAGYDFTSWWRLGRKEKMNTD